jgi:hypothetical protein
MVVALPPAKPEEPMDIRFISTLTADDEGQMAPALMNAVTALLDALPIAYTLRIETLGAQVFQHTHPSADSAHSAMGVENPLRRRTEGSATLLS